jgi:transposase InsO family protein
VIARLRADFPVSYLCSKLGVSTSGFYDWVSAVPTATTIRRQALTAQVIVEFTNSNNVAGYRKVTASFHRAGIAVDRKTIATIMAGQGLRSPAAIRAFRRKKLRTQRGNDPKDLLMREFGSLVPGSILVGDITYVNTKQGWLYVATVIDLASRSVLGHASGATQTAALLVTAMNRARKSGLIRPGAIFHSDHGTQYRSKRFANYCAQAGIRQSMGARMECWDNAAAESFFSKMKSERLDWTVFATRKEAATVVDDYIDHFNNARLHQSLGYATPAEKLIELVAA